MDMVNRKRIVELLSEWEQEIEEVTSVTFDAVAAEASERVDWDNPPAGAREAYLLTADTLEVYETESIEDAEDEVSCYFGPDGEACEETRFYGAGFDPTMDLKELEGCQLHRLIVGTEPVGTFEVHVVTTPGNEIAFLVWMEG